MPYYLHTIVLLASISSISTSAMQLEFEEDESASSPYTAPSSNIISSADFTTHYIAASSVDKQWEMVCALAWHIGLLQEAHSKNGVECSSKNILKTKCEIFSSLTTPLFSLRLPDVRALLLKRDALKKHLEGWENRLLSSKTITQSVVKTITKKTLQ